MKMLEELIEPLPVAEPAPTDHHRVLLVDTDPSKRKLRLASLTRMGMSVCCATDAAQARMLLRESPYNLVLINLPRDRQAALKLEADMKEDRPEQCIRFFVGKPSYLAQRPLPEHESGNDGASDPAKKLHALIARTCDGLPGRGRLLEAAWRMSFLRRGRSTPAISSNREPAQHSFAKAVRLAEIEGMSE